MDLINSLIGLPAHRIDYQQLPDQMTALRAYNSALANRDPLRNFGSPPRSDIQKLSDHFQSLGLEKEAIRKICQKALFEAYKEKVDD